MIHRQQVDGAGRRIAFGGSLRTKLYGSFLVVAFAGLAVGGILVDRNVEQGARAEVEDRLSYETTMLGQMTANALFGDIDPTDTSLNESVHALGNAVHTQLAVIAPDGTVVAASDSADPRSLPSQRDKPEIVAARATGSRGTAIREGRVFVAGAIRSDGKQIGFARSSVGMDVVEAHVHAVRVRMAYGAAIALLVAVLLGYVLSSRILRPIRALFVGAERVGAGDFDHPIVVTTGDEIGELSRAFNEMTSNLRQTIAKLDGRNHDMRLVLDNVNQGLLTLDRVGVISKERSLVLDEWLGPVRPGTTFWDYIQPVDRRTSGMFRHAWEALLEGVLPIEVTIEQLPRRLVGRGHEYELKYTLLAGVSGLLITISDVTARVAAERGESVERQITRAFGFLLRDKAAFIEFFVEAGRLVATLRDEVRPPLPVVKRLLHTLKGNAPLFGLTWFGSLCHRLEDRIEVSGADLSKDEREELALSWDDLAKRLRALLGERMDLGLEVYDKDLEALLRAVVRGASRYELARAIAEWKLERTEPRLRHFGEQAVALGERMGKAPIDVDVQAPELRLSREALAPFWGAFVHVIRNAVDHGIEADAERIAAGKPAHARLRLSAKRIGEDVVLEVTDDGRGIDWDGVAESARNAGLPHAHMLDLTEALFCDGLSTKADVAEVSGRGVGLAAVRAECAKLSGTVSVTSERSQGTTFRFKWPARTVTVMDPRLGALVQRAVGLQSSTTQTRSSTLRETVEPIEPE
jgi:two-component system, chemotaxis family, sensor kinase CheA